MKTIYKYELDVVIRQTIYVPRDAGILSIQFQNNTLCLWAYIDTDKPTIPLPVRIYGTGQEVEYTEGLKYITTVQQCDLVWHIFLET